MSELTDREIWYLVSMVILMVSGLSLWAYTIFDIVKGRLGKKIVREKLE